MLAKAPAAPKAANQARKAAPTNKATGVGRVPAQHRFRLQRSHIECIGRARSIEYVAFN